MPSNPNQLQRNQATHLPVWAANGRIFRLLALLYRLTLSITTIGANKYRHGTMHKLELPIGPVQPVQVTGSSGRRQVQVLPISAGKLQR
jgi:hypothetical protein